MHQRTEIPFCFLNYKYRHKKYAATGSIAADSIVISYPIISGFEQSSTTDNALSNAVPSNQTVYTHSKNNKVIGIVCYYSLLTVSENG